MNETSAQLNALIRRKAGHAPPEDHAEDVAEEDDGRTADFDGGARRVAPAPTNMNALLRRAAGF